MPSLPPVITEAVDLGILPSSTAVPVTATLIPTITALPTVTSLPSISVSTQVAVAPPPTAVILPVPPTVTPLPLVADNPAVAPSNAFVVNPNTFVVQAPPGSVAGNTLYADVMGGQTALVENQDIDHPGFGYSLRINDEPLVGSPLPSDTIRFKAVQWSPNGAMLAFIAETPGSRGDGQQRIGDTISDGLWVWTMDAGDPTQFTHHAQRNLYAYDRGNDAARMVRDFTWAPDSAALLVQYDREGGYPAINGVINPGWDANADPLRIEHEFASWSNDGGRVLVSGLKTNGGPILGWVDRGSGQLAQTLVDGAAQNPSLWMQNAAEMPDGRIAFIGAPYYTGNPNDGRNSTEIGLYIYNSVNVLPVRVSLIGGGPVRAATWNEGHTAVLLKLAGGRTVIAQTNGGIRDITGQVGDSNVTWGQ